MLSRAIHRPLVGVVATALTCFWRPAPPRTRAAQRRAVANPGRPSCSCTALADASSVVVNGGTLSLVANSDTVAAVQLLSGSITSTTGVLVSTSDYDLQAGTVSAILGGSVGVNKGTAGIVTLSGVNTYTGATTVNMGTLRLGAANRIADTSALSVARMSGKPPMSSGMPMIWRGAEPITRRKRPGRRSMERISENSMRRSGVSACVRSK